jgi:hypothetical protein
VIGDEAVAALTELQLELYGKADTHPLQQQQQYRLYYPKTEELSARLCTGAL